MNRQGHLLVNHILSRCNGICIHNGKLHLLCHNSNIRMRNKTYQYQRFNFTSVVPRRDHQVEKNFFNNKSQSSCRQWKIFFHHSLFRRSFSNYAHMFENQLLQTISCNKVSRLFSSVLFPTNLNIDGAKLNEISEIEYSHELEVEGDFQDIDESRFVTTTKLQPNYIHVSKDNSSRNRVKTRNSNTEIKYPLKGMGVSEPVYTTNFENCKTFLESLSIPTDELQFYPDIQEMNEDDITICVGRLKKYQIHVLFSLFLIQRIFVEINLERTVIREPTPNPKQPFKLRNGMYKLTSIRNILFYLELCKLLDNPYLDPVSFLEDLARVGIYDHLQTITNKTKKLRSVGATAKDIMSNLKLYYGSTLFNSKIKLYQNVIGESDGPFPIQLFLSSTVVEFKKKLHLGNEVNVVAKLLNVKEEDFLMCWGFKSIHTKSLVYKVQMCLKAGIPQTDIFNNIGILDRITVDQCHRVTKSLCESGQPGSVFVFKALESNIQHRTRNGNNGTEESDWTGKSEDYDTSSNQLDSPATKNNSSTKMVSSVNKTIQSSKMWRREVFKLIAYLLKLDQPSKCAMYKTDINIDPTQLIDVTRNLEFLLSQSFTKEDIRQCPIILAHPYESLVRVKKELKVLFRESVALTHSLLSSPSSLTPNKSVSVSVSSDSTLANQSGRNNNDNNNKCEHVSHQDISEHLTSNPVTHLNLIQYYLEKETNFSLNYAETQSVVEFLN